MKYDNLLVRGPSMLTVHHPKKNSMTPILFCSLDLIQQEKWMPTEKYRDRLTMAAIFQYGRPEILTTLISRLVIDVGS